MKFLKSIIPVLFLLLLVACGENSTTEKIVQTDSSEFTVVADVTGLPKCSADNDGELVWVKNENTPGCVPTASGMPLPKEVSRRPASRSLLKTVAA